MLVASGIAIAPPLLSVSMSPSLIPMPSELPCQHCSDQPKQDDSSSSEDAGEHKCPVANPMPCKNPLLMLLLIAAAAVTVTMPMTPPRLTTAQAG